MTGYTPLAERDANTPLSPSSSGNGSKTRTQKHQTAQFPSSTNAMSSNSESRNAGGVYRSPSDVASPVSQKLTAMKTRRMNKNNLKQRSLFANTVSNQHLKSSTTAPHHSTGSQSEGSMADDELDGGLSDKSDDTVILRRSEVSRDERLRNKILPESEDKPLDDGYLADESERN